jgi:predicted nucleotidyltransferase
MLLNISGKINSLFVDILSTMNTVAVELDIPFFVVGATARDIIYEHCYGIVAIRRTKDIDIGIRILDSNKFSLLISTLISSHGFEKTEQTYRIKKNGILVDVIPFGPIAAAEMNIDLGSIMSVLGFEEAYSHSQTMRINDAPVLDIRIPIVPGLLVMKLIAWDEKYPSRKKDAQDLLFIMKHYEDTDVKERLYTTEAALLTEEKFDCRNASIRLLGRDIVRILDGKTLTKIKQILVTETSEDAYKLVKDMRETIFDNDKIFALLEKLKQGLFD